MALIAALAILLTTASSVFLIALACVKLPFRPLESGVANLQIVLLSYSASL
jgi:hypothetical protein